MSDRMTEASIKQALSADSDPQRQGETILALLRSAAAGREQTVSAHTVHPAQSPHDQEY